MRNYKDERHKMLPLWRSYTIGSTRFLKQPLQYNMVESESTEEGQCRSARTGDSRRLGASLAAQRVKNPPAMWETWVRSLGWEDPLEKGKATHSSILAWRIPWTV